MRAFRTQNALITLALLHVACGGNSGTGVSPLPVPSPSAVVGSPESTTPPAPPPIEDGPGADPVQAPSEPPLESPYREDVERLVTGTWSRLPVPAGDCQEAVADDAAASVPALSWGACPGASPGWACSLADWTTSATVEHALTVTTQDPVLRNGQPQFVIRRSYRWSETGIARLDAVQSLAEPALYARLRGHRGELCPGHLNVSAMGISDFVYGDAGTGGNGALLLWALWSVPKLYEHRWFYPGDFGFQAIVDVFFGREDLFVSTVAPKDTVFVELATGYAGTKWYPQTTWTTESPLPYDQGLIAISRARGERPALFFHTRKERSFIERAHDALDMVDHRIDRAKDEVVWTERELLPFYSHGAGLLRVARKNFLGGFSFETEFPIPASKPHAGFVVNGGEAVVVDPKGDALVLRTTDGKGWRIPQPEGLTTVKPVWVDENFVWLGVAPQGQDGVLNLSGIARIDRKTLGEPGDVYKAE